jgi:hypothetical protein
MTADNVITIATSTGTLAEEAGRLPAETLGFCYVDDQVIEWAAERAGVSHEEVDEVEHSQPLVARILQSLATYPRSDDIVWALDAVPYADPSPLYRGLIRDVIEQIANAGGAVIVAHGAGMLLTGRPKVLRVFVTASPAVRAQRIASERGCTGDEAARIVQLASHYDPVIDTDALDPPDAARLIASAAQSRSALPSPEGEGQGEGWPKQPANVRAAQDLSPGPFPAEEGATEGWTPPEERMTSSVPTYRAT